jgi:hypothetical protein
MLNDFALLGFGFGFSLVLSLILLIIFIFEVVMFINAILNKKISDTAKILWIIGMLIIHPFVAIAYYFTDYKKQSNF